VIDFPDEAAEFEILCRHARQSLDFASRVAQVEAVVGQEEIMAGRALVDGIRLDETIIRYVLNLVRATRSDPAGPRSLSMRGVQDGE
jgi:MoxR-like ATPase